MTSTDDTGRNERCADPFAGYFASVGLALLVSGWLAALVEVEAARRFSMILSSGWVVNLEAGFFLGLAFSNPVGLFVARQSKRSAFLRFVLAFAFGVLLQHNLFTPLAGPSLSRYIFLILAFMAFPAVGAYRALDQWLAARGIDIPGQSLMAASAAAQLPQRVHFVIFMIFSFLVAYLLDATVPQLVAVQVLILSAITLVVALGNVSDDDRENPAESEYRLWLELEDDGETATPEMVTQLVRRLRDIVISTLPTAALFGTMMMLALHFVDTVYPQIQAQLAGDAAGVRLMAVIAASGLAVVLFGTMAGLGLALTVMRVIGWFRHWTPQHVQENCLRLVQLLYFRPLKRS